jgi:pimeloyl-ACP methyl ester carboxylesterase
MARAAGARWIRHRQPHRADGGTEQTRPGPRPGGIAAAARHRRPDPLTARAHQEFWYQRFHQLAFADLLVDGSPDAVRAYLRHFWPHWSGPGLRLAGDRLDHLVLVYAQPGAFTAGISWYRAGAGTVAQSLAEQVPQPADRIAVPTTVLWPEHDPLFPTAWSDRLADFFADIRLLHLDGIGHFTPVEAPHGFAAAVAAAAARR